MNIEGENDLWVAGWVWGKYPEHAANYSLPKNDVDAGEWLEGFQWGATEACQFERLWDWMAEVLRDHTATLVLVRGIAQVDRARQS